MNQTGKRRLNVGCGTDIREGYVNLDIAPLPGVDMVHDMHKLPLPFQSEEFDEILCKDVLEHLEYIDVLRELHRILRVGGVLIVRVPHFTSRDNFADPTHRHRFSIKTFDFFVKDSAFGRGYYFDFAFARVSSIHLDFRKGLLIHNYLAEALFNCHPQISNVYEMTGLCYLFPASDMRVEIIK